MRAVSPYSPQLLEPNPTARFYHGGVKLGRFRGRTFGEYDGEDWVGSTTSASNGPDGFGLSRLADGSLLRDAIRADPQGWLGPDHVARFGDSLELLVKLLDAGERLPVHLHPTRPVALAHLNCPYGKTEAWLVIDAPADGAVYLGFSREIAVEQLAGWVESQDTESMLNAMNRLTVRAGDAVFVPAGVPHAIGAGILVVELQEPTDFSVVLEWKGFAIEDPTRWHIGLGAETVMGLTDRTAWTTQRLASVRQSSPEPVAAGRGSMLPAAADEFFRAELVTDGAVLADSLSILVCIDGTLALTAVDGSTVTTSRGETYLLPAAAGPVRVGGQGSAIRCRPPSPLTRRTLHPTLMPAT